MDVIHTFTLNLTVKSGVHIIHTTTFSSIG